MLRSIQRLLTASRLAVEPFSSAEEFLRRQQDVQPACLVLDINLPGMTGLELRRRLAVAGDGLPVIFITAFDDEDLKASALDMGCSTYLQKPFSPEALVAAVRSALGDA